MEKRYGYAIEFLSKELSPTGTKFVRGTGECKLREMQKSFENFLNGKGLTYSGGKRAGSVLNAKGQMIGEFYFYSDAVAC